MMVTQTTMGQPEGDTPRTDAVLSACLEKVTDPGAALEDLARELERELASMTTARDRTADLLREAIEENTKLRDAVSTSGALLTEACRIGLAIAGHYHPDTPVDPWLAAHEKRLRELEYTATLSATGKLP